MQKLNKVMHFLKHVVKMTFSNIPRLLLSISGLFIGLFILTIGLMVMNSYYAENMYKAEMFADNSLVIQLDGEEKNIDKFVSKFNGGELSQRYISEQQKTVYIQKYTNGYYVILNTKIVGTMDMGNSSVLGKYDDNTYIPYNAELVAGRFISASDVANENRVTVIDKFTADLIFGDENPIGKKITLGISETGMASIAQDNKNNETEITEFEIIGVYNSDVITLNNYLELNKFKKNGQKNLSLNTMVYIPETVYLQMYELNNKCMIVNCKNSNEYDKVEKFLTDYKLVYSSDFTEFNIITKASIIELLRNELKPVKMFMWLILLLLLIISGINSMNTMFFSVKERISEIGIKKSLGAGKAEITIQFMLEGVLMALLSGILAVFGGVLVGKYIGLLIQNIMYINFPIVYSFESILLPLSIAIIYGIVFSFIPSYYGANIKVTDALRFE